MVQKMRLRNSVTDPMSYPSTATASSLLHCASLCLRWAAGVGLEMKIKYMYHKHELSNINQVVKTFKYCEWLFANNWQKYIIYQLSNSLFFSCPSSSIPTLVTDWLNDCVDCVEFSFRMLTKPDQTYLTYLCDLFSWPTWSTWPPDIPTHTWPAYPSVLPTNLICSPVHITSQIQ